MNLRKDHYRFSEQTDVPNFACGVMASLSEGHTVLSSKWLQDGSCLGPPSSETYCDLWGTWLMGLSDLGTRGAFFSSVLSCCTNGVVGNSVREVWTGVVRRRLRETHLSRGICLGEGLKRAGLLAAPPWLFFYSFPFHFVEITISMGPILQPVASAGRRRH